MKIPKDMEFGSTHVMRSGVSLIVTKYKSHKEVSVKFPDTGFSTKATAGNIRSGKVKDLFTPNVLGVGFIGSGRYKSRVNGNPTIEYRAWRNMLDRCYSEKYKKSKPSYSGCVVCDEWHNFQNFAEWFNDNYIHGCQLDKDILSGGKVGKIYSPETCKFVSNQENMEHSISKWYEFIDPNGNEIKVYNIQKFSRDNGLNQSHMISVSKGRIPSHKGYTTKN